MNKGIKLPVIFFVLNIFFSLPGFLFAEYDPPPGGELLYDFFSPELLSSASPLVSTEAPLSCFNNPAAGGFLQRVTAALNYTGLNGKNNDEEWGNVINGGLSVPGRAGVFSASAMFMNSGFDTLDYGTFGKLNFAFSKDLFDNLSVGSALVFTAGENDNSDWGIGLDLGILHYPEEFFNEKNFRWGAVLKNIGRGYSPSDYTPFPSPFTPGFGCGVTLIESEKFSFDFSADLFSPYFQSIRAELGGDFRISNLFNISIGSRMDPEDPGNELNFFPSVGISFGFNADLEKFDIDAIKKRKWDQTEILTSASYTRISEDLDAYSLGFRIPFGVRDEKGPVIDLLYDSVAYISPNNDGKSDDLILPLSIEDERYIKGYEFVITSPEGEQIRKYANKDERAENLTFENVFERLKYVKTGIAVPERLRWDGNTDERSPAEDGEYDFYVTAWDDNGNKGESSRYKVVVDRTPPSVSVSSPPVLERIFSPNGDGSRDFLTLRQTGSPEDLWEGRFIDNNGRTVRTVRWENREPGDFFWDGTDDNGILLSDGVYTYEISATDRAENRASAGVANIIISTMNTPVSLSISSSAFSPDNNRINDFIEFSFNVPVRSDISGWTFDIIDKTGAIRNSFEGFDDIPEKYIFYGLSRDRKILPEDSYRGRLQIVYRNGNMPEAYSPEFIIDITPPSVSVDSEYSVFSPNGDGKKDVLLLNQKTSNEDEWEGLISDEKGNPVYRYSWHGKAGDKVEWDGINDKGRIAPDGKYFYSLSSTDRAGNRGESEVVSFSIDTEETPVMLSREYPVFSPNSDGIKDTITFYPELRKKDGVEKYRFSVSDSSGQEVFVKEGQGSLPERFVWDGKEMVGNISSGKSYRAGLDILYINGNNPSAGTPLFSIDTEYPVLEVSSAYVLFSPNGDGKKDSLPVEIIRSSNEDLWLGNVRNSSGDVVRSFSWNSMPETVFWDGRDNSGNIMDDGIYSLDLFSEDSGGNRTDREINNIKIDNRLTSAIVSVDIDGFSPNNDLFLDEVEFGLYVSPFDGIESWELSVSDSSGKKVKTFKGAERIPEIIKWDGKEGKTTVPSGRYKADLSVLYKKGDNPVSSTREFVLDTDPPESDIILTPYPFSPDNDGVDDELMINLSLTDLSGIRDWSLEISDPVGSSFRHFSGKGKPTEKIIWDGISDTGELVQAAEDYPFLLKASDNLGNIHERRGFIPVDVLVIRDGDRLKIRISSIKFSPNTPELVTDIPEVREKNEKIIDRLSVILNKYSTYNIRIEGHANNLSWADPAKARIEENEELIPLSNARCETVKKILVEKGVSAKRISMEGLGGTEPVVPFSDLKNRWKNRRVEFILIK